MQLTDVRKTIDTTALAAVGMTDAAVAKIRKVRDEVATVRPSRDVRKLVDRVQDLPETAVNRAMVLASRANDNYEALAARGEKVVGRVRNQKATKDLLAQAESAMSVGKGFFTTVRKSVADVVAEVDADADVVTAEVKKTATTARTATKRTTTRGKAAATSARKTASAAKKAASDAANKLG